MGLWSERDYIYLLEHYELYTMVYPYLSYCNVVRASTYPSRLDSLYKVKKKILRIITFSKYLQESRQLFILLQMLNIYELNSYQIGLFMYSYTKGSLPSAFSNYFSSNNTIHKHYTRSSKKFHMKYTRTNKLLWKILNKI